MSLQKYRHKRKFGETPEPKGKARKRLRAADWRKSFGKLRTRKVVKKKLAFVIQEHHASRLHFDFRLEMEGVLKSWAVPKGPSMDPHEKHLAVMVEDHPFAYRKFAGTIPEGNYGAGTVSIWDEGTYEPLADGDDPQKLLLAQLKKGEIKIILHGKKLTGAFVLVRMKGEEGKNWLLIKEKDDQVLKEKNLQALFRHGKKRSMPHAVSPMLAKLADAPFTDPQWVFEVKWDGYRAIAEKKKDKLRLYSRNNQDYTTVYPDVVTELQKINHDVVLDGEIVALDEHGNVQFQLLQSYRHDEHKGHLLYYVFDLLYIDGFDVRSLSLIERKALLKQILPESERLKYSDHIDTHGFQLFDLAREKGLEGIMAKRKNSLYVSSRSNEWQKIKNLLSQEAIICGFTKPKGQRKEFGALILGLYDGGELRYIGHTGGGFAHESLGTVKKLLEPLITDTAPFVTTPLTNTPATWVKPIIVCQVKFSGWTIDGLMRQPVFLGIREDKKAKDVTVEQPAEKAAIKTIHFTPSHLSKIFWPEEGYTKGDLLSYYDRVSPFILPYLKDRPESMFRHPDGITGESFFHKDIQHAPKWVKTVPMYSEKDKKNIHWLICNDRETLLYMANLGCIEINPWSSRLSKKEYPDYLIIDLDPQGVTFAEVVTTAKAVKKILEKADLTGFVKTSGKTGLHILLPLGARYTFEQTRKFAELLAGIVVGELPDTTSVVRDPKKREKKVYIDFLQNRVGQTITAPYAVRPVGMASVSTPLAWEELTTSLLPTDFTIKNIFKRLSKKGDVWKGFLNHKGVDILKSLKRLEHYK